MAVKQSTIIKGNTKTLVIPKSRKSLPAMPQKKSTVSTADQFIKKLMLLRSEAELKKVKSYFKSEEGKHGAGDTFIGVRMGQVFSLAKEHQHMSLKEMEKLLESPVHEARVGAVSIMDFLARNKKTNEDVKKGLFDLYIRRHDRVNNWDLVDRAAIHVVGAWLFDKPRNVLYKLAKSKNMWERRTAIVSTAYFLSKKDRSDTFKIAEILVNDPEDLIQKAYGGWIRQAGKGDKTALLNFLDKHAATMPRIALRYAIEHLDAKQKRQYMELKLKQQNKK